MYSIDLPAMNAFNFDAHDWMQLHNVLSSALPTYSHHQFLPPFTTITEHHQTLITLEGTLPTPQDLDLRERIAPPLFEMLQGLLGRGLSAVAYRAQLRRLRALLMREAFCRCVNGIGMRTLS